MVVEAGVEEKEEEQGFSLRERETERKKEVGGKKTTNSTSH